MCNPLTALAAAYTPDTTRTGPETLAHRPEWFVQCLARLILFLIKHWLAHRSSCTSLLPSWWEDRTDLPAGSAQAEAAEARGPFGNSIAWMCQRHGYGPGHKDWPELSRAIVAFGGSLEGFHADTPPLGLQWWENPKVVPGMSGMAAEMPAAMSTALLLARQVVADSPPPASNAVAAEARHVPLPAAWLSAAWWQGFLRPGTGPPTGPPVARVRCPELPTLSCLTHGAGARLAPPY